MSRGIKLQAEPIRYLDGASITNNYQALSNSYLTSLIVTDKIFNSGFQHLIRMLILQNNTDGYVLVAFEQDPDFVAEFPDYGAIRMTPGQSIIFDFTANKAGNKDGFFLGMGDQIWIKNSPAAYFIGDTAATTGNFTASAFYALGDGSAE